MQEGDEVRAVSQVTEENFTPRGGTHVHAEPGDVGRVRAVCDGEWVTVEFERSGTSTDCHISEIELVAIAANA